MEKMVEIKKKIISKEIKSEEKIIKGKEFDINLDDKTEKRKAGKSGRTRMEYSGIKYEAPTLEKKRRWKRK